MKGEDMKNNKGFTGIEFDIGLTVVICLLGFGWFFGGDGFKEAIGIDVTSKHKLTDVIEMLKDAKEERHIYRDLSMLLLRQQTDESEKKAYEVIDQWLEDNRDCVNIEFEYAKVKGNKIKIELKGYKNKNESKERVKD